MSQPSTQIQKPGQSTPKFNIQCTIDVPYEYLKKVQEFKSTIREIGGNPKIANREIHISYNGEKDSPAFDPTKFKEFMEKMRLIIPEKALNSTVLYFSERIPFSLGVKQLMDGHASKGRRNIGHLLLAKRVGVNMPEENMQVVSRNFSTDFSTEFLVGRGLDRSDLPDEISGTCKWIQKDSPLTSIHIDQMTRLITHMRTQVLEALDQDAPHKSM